MRKVGLPVTEKWRKWYREGDKQVAGFLEAYGNLTFVTVKASGHMVPTDQPQNLLHILNRFITNRPL